MAIYWKCDRCGRDMNTSPNVVWIDDVSYDLCGDDMAELKEWVRGR